MEDLSQSHEGKITVKIKKGEDSYIPQKVSEGAAGHDLRAALTVKLEPYSVTQVPLGIFCALPPGFCLEIKSKSGLASRGILVTGGLIDSDYRGQLKALLYNSTNKPFKIMKKQRCVQCCVRRVHQVTWQPEAVLDRTMRDDRALGEMTAAVEKDEQQMTVPAEPPESTVTVENTI
ncbi:dUTP diphosphatase [Litorimonas sp.]|uniref:dUTP diphosphatase n=1 Tax=Litorimonas sp. TaxID=1892381 RepID=UPI003A847F70